jgi:hypothetical protein
MVDLKPTINKFCSSVGVGDDAIASPDHFGKLCQDGSLLLRFLKVTFPYDLWTLYPISDAGFQGVFFYVRKCVDCELDRDCLPCPLHISGGQSIDCLVSSINLLMSKVDQQQSHQHSGPVSEECDVCTCLVCRWKNVVRVLSSEEHVFGKLSHSVRRLVEEGIPKVVREHAWLILSGALQKVRARHPSYISLFPRALEESRHVDLIDLDISRTFQDSAEWRRKKFDQVTRRILIAYSIRNPTLGYCQGLSYIAGLLATVASEEVAFCIFTTVIEDGLLPPDYYTTLKGAVVDQQVLEILVERFIPNLSLSEEISFLSIPWSMCLFSTSFSMDVSIRLLDFLFAFGPCVLFRVSLGLLNSLGSCSGSNVREKLRLIEQTTSSSDIALFFSMFDSVSNELVEEIRNTVRSGDAQDTSSCYLSVLENGEASSLRVSDDHFFGGSSDPRCGGSESLLRKEARRRVLDGLCKFMFS